MGGLGSLFEFIQKYLLDIEAFLGGGEITLPGFSKVVSAFGQNVQATLTSVKIQKLQAANTGANAPASGGLKLDTLKIIEALFSDYEKFISGQVIHIPEFSETVMIAGFDVKITISGIDISKAQVGASLQQATPTATAGSPTVSPGIEGSPQEESTESDSQKAIENSKTK